MDIEKIKATIELLTELTKEIIEGEICIIDHESEDAYCYWIEQKEHIQIINTIELLKDIIKQSEI